MEKIAVVAGRRLEGKHVDRLEKILKEVFTAALKSEELQLETVRIEEEQGDALKDASVVVIMISEPEETYREMKGLGKRLFLPFPQPLILSHPLPDRHRRVIGGEPCPIHCD
ncbi:hypothetical protein M3212_05140 [Alkalihalobacillus oceani]|uniref:hypothetical protein n=1 Tax=Halalkalibacter oceani TaxID=1653776 RepID=UPI00203F57E0|nr:hypothetical protein [Halalkalibacter oceani]MCM3760173.1 hypothetical protein [Halalkalibacter oceani]